jgi:hypothetical protein
MKPVFGNAATSAPKAASFQRHRRFQRQCDGEEDDDAAGDQPHAQYHRVEQIEDRRAGAEAEQQAGQREVEDEAVQPRDRALSGSRRRRAAT